MSGPWEKYAATAASAAPASSVQKPWEKYSPQPEQPPERGLLSRIGHGALNAGLGTLNAVGRTIARVTSAPLSAGLNSALDVATKDENLNKSTLSQIPEGLTAFVKGAANQFGREPDNARTFKEANERAGVSQTPLSDVAPGLFNATGEGLKLKKGGFFDATPAGALGAVEEMAVPIPGLTELGMLGKAAAPIARVAGKGIEGAAKVADIATGTKAASNVINATKAFTKTTGETFTGAREGLKNVFKAKQADDFGESVKTAMKNGIDPKLLPEAVEFGPSSIMTRTAKVEAEGITGQPLLEKHMQGLEQVRDAIHRDIENLGGGAPVIKPDAGKILRDGFNTGVDRAFDAVNTSHGEIIKEAPGLRLAPSQVEKIAPKLEALEGWAKQKAENGLTNTAKGQGQQILNAINSFRKKGESYAGSLEALQEIGDVAFKSKNVLADIPPDVSRFRKLYGDISDAMIGTVEENLGADKAHALVESNAAMHKIYGDKSLLGKLGQENLSDESLFQSIIQHGDTKRIAALKEYLQPEQLAALKGSFLNELIKEGTHGDFPFKSLHNALRQNKTVVGALFEPGEIDNLNSLVKLGDKFGNAVMSTSGTGASNAIRESIKEIGNSIMDKSVSDGLKTKARAIGFDVNDPLRNAAQGTPRPPTMGLAPNNFTGSQILKIPDWRKRAARAYSSNQDQSQP